jgi:DNA-directed RNA polymerase specialized sigma subunit
MNLLGAIGHTPLVEIAADLGVSESRVSQLLTAARRRVRAEAGLTSD